MKNEALFTEEVEPPGIYSGLVQIDFNAEDLFSTHHTLLSYPVARTTGVPYSFRFKESQKSRTFRRRFYPHITSSEWNDWTWQFRNRIRDIESLAQILWLAENERQAMDHHSGSLPVAPAVTSSFVRKLNMVDMRIGKGPLCSPVREETIGSSHEGKSLSRR